VLNYNQVCFPLHLYWHWRPVIWQAASHNDFCCPGSLPPSNCGGLISEMVMVVVFMGLLADPASSRPYKMFNVPFGTMFALFLLWLGISGMRTLDVGSGNDYLTACFAIMVGPDDRAVGIEQIPELVASTENVQKRVAAPLLKHGALSSHVADGRLGYPGVAPYNAIDVGAAAP
jgi:protein-L-isoaspartate O-methyltransferase